MKSMREIIKTGIKDRVIIQIIFVDELHNFFFNIRLFPNIFFYILRKIYYSINFNNLIYISIYEARMFNN